MNEQQPQAAAKDAAAIDALVQAGFDLSRVAPSAERRRVSHIASLLGLLRAGPAPDSSLVDVTLARILKSDAAPQRDLEAVLSISDQEALDAMAMTGFDASRVPSSLRDRARKHEALLSAVTSPSLVADESLMERTLVRIQEHSDAEKDRMSIESVRSRRGRSGLRLADIISVAAVVLVGFGIMLPVLTTMREQSRRALCKTNLGNTAMAMSTYAGANRDSLPVSTASLGPSGTWWEVGKAPQHSNSANLYTLARTGYVPLSSLACPGNPAAPTANVSPEARDWRCLEEVSYSYQIMFGPQRPEWRSGSPAVVLADRSPVVLRAIRGERVDPMSNAPNHESQGQHLLRNDGSVVWATSPVLSNGDNIWLPRSIEVRLRQLFGKETPSLNGRETPEAEDVFLGP